MTPTPGNVSKYPILIGDRVRAWLDWKRLDVGKRLKVKVTRHARGYYFSPLAPDDSWAIAWIDALAARYGTLKWKRGKWVREKLPRKPAGA